MSGTHCGITGSSSKTTTTTLVGRSLQPREMARYLWAEYRHSLLDDIPNMSVEDLVVLELSSFQLENLPYSPEYALVTNVTPNHLDIHKTMEAYIEAKRHILAFQQPGDYVVLNYDNDITRSLLLRSVQGRCFISAVWRNLSGALSCAMG